MAELTPVEARESDLFKLAELEILRGRGHLAGGEVALSETMKALKNADAEVAGFRLVMGLKLGTVTPEDAERIRAIPDVTERYKVTELIRVANDQAGNKVRGN